MKKKLMMCFAAAALLAGGAFTTKAVVEKNLDPWIESNLEALSQVEPGAHGTGVCYKVIMYVEDLHVYLLYCGDCTYTRGMPFNPSMTGECH